MLICERKAVLKEMETYQLGLDKFKGMDAAVFGVSEAFSNPENCRSIDLGIYQIADRLKRIPLIL
jgi:hypothetical protein